MAVSKEKLAEMLAEKTDLSKTKAGEVITAMQEAITECLSKGEKVTLVGFGTFETRHRAATTGRNPRTGEEIQIAAANKPAFRAGKALKEAVN